jgi:TfoX/Sxy family transcriptional regulator of competence genes
MGYWQVPADVLEDRDELAAWAREALGVALAKRGKRPHRRPAAPARRRSRR